MDHFTHNIIRNELLAITARPPPDPADWAFSPFNDRLFAGSCAPGEPGASSIPPEEWVARGFAQMQGALGQF